MSATAAPGSGQKARVALRVMEAVGAGTPKVTSRVDIHQATEKFRILQKRLKSLTSLLEKQISLIAQLNKTRLEVAQQVAALSSGSPLEAICVGNPSNKAESESFSKGDELGVSRQTAFGTISVASKGTALETLISHAYLEVHRTSNERSTMYTQRFKEHVLKYTVEWETSITSRIDAGLKELEKQRLDLEHYSRKFEALRLSANKLMSSGKTVPTATADKLKRNEMKLLHAKHNYEVYSSSFALLISEVTERCWKDLHPLLVKVIQFDSALAADENKNFSLLNDAAAKLKKIGVDNSLDPKGRLLGIQSLKPEELFTGDKTNPLGRRLTGEAGQIIPVSSLTTSSGSFASTGSLGGSFTNEWNSNPNNMIANSAPTANNGNAFYNPFESSGNVGGSKLDGNNPFAPSGSSNVSINPLNSFNAAQKPNILSQVDMLDLAASSAPPPTMSDINEATTTMMISSNQPSNQWAFNGSGWPVLQSQAAASQNPNSVSRASFSGSDINLLSSAPIPPSMPPPPPPPFTAYGNNTGNSYGGSTLGHDIFSAPAPSATMGSNLMGGSVGNPFPSARRSSSNPFDP
jgi:hypothetical protein